MEEEITIKAEWLRGLLDWAEKVENAKDILDKDSATNYLLGYISSAKSILERSSN